MGLMYSEMFTIINRAHPNVTKVFKATEHAPGERQTNSEEKKAHLVQ